MLWFLLTPNLYASGGYDHGTATGERQLQLDFTWNPFDLIEFGQSYVVWGYGLTDRLDFHGYYTHEAIGVDHVVYGLFYQFADLSFVDLATSVAMRVRKRKRQLYFPQLLYNFKLGEGFTIGGSLVEVRNYDKNAGREGVTFDTAFFMPLEYFFEAFKDIPYIDEWKFAVGLFKPTSHKVYPTYSIDIKSVPLW